MNFRWYETYDKNGVESGQTLQEYNAERESWEDIPYVREREGLEEEGAYDN